ncbi:hypothetical protein CWM52_07770 [Raoultella sp. T31]|nr:hypothetical protein CWM52_07770 [Raoultella sp. T31]
MRLKKTVNRSSKLFFVFQDTLPDIPNPMILLKSAAIRYKIPAKQKTEPAFSLKIKIPFHFLK